MIYPTIQISLCAGGFLYVANRLKGFAAGAGSVLFFEGREALEGPTKSQPMAVPLIPKYSNTSSGVLQYAGLVFHTSPFFTGFEIFCDPCVTK